MKCHISGSIYLEHYLYLEVRPQALLDLVDDGRKEAAPSLG